MDAAEGHHCLEHFKRPPSNRLRQAGAGRQSSNLSLLKELSQRSGQDDHDSCACHTKSYHRLEEDYHVRDTAGSGTAKAAAKKIISTVLTNG